MGQVLLLVFISRGKTRTVPYLSHVPSSYKTNTLSHEVGDVGLNQLRENMNLSPSLLVVSECYNIVYMQTVSYNCTPPLTLILHSFLKQRVCIEGMIHESSVK